MFPSEGSSGAFTLLVGLAVLVFLGIGLSVMVDRRFEFSSSASDLRKDLLENSEILDQLHHRLGKLETTFNSQQNRANYDRYSRLTLLLEDLALVTDQLSALPGKLTGELEAIDQGFSQYRTEYRRVKWTSAIGEALGDLRVRGGRVYRKAVVRNVTPVGLEIDHEDGLARIQAPDLDPVYQDRFQWDAEERRRALETERAAREQMAKAIPGKQATVDEVISADSPPAKPPRFVAPPDVADLAALRMQVQAWNAKVNLLAAQADEATVNAATSGRRSVPGSLETWQGRRIRIDSELGRAVAELSAARSRLAAMAPQDPLLKAVALEN